MDIIYKLSFLFVFGLMISACGSNETEDRPLDLGKDYYPLTVGESWTYAYDSVVFNRQFNTVDSISGFIREVITDQINEDGDSPMYRMERHQRRIESDPWKINTVWSVTLEENRLIRTEENLPFVKLLFPVQKETKWDGNVFIDEYLNVSIQGDPIQMYISWDYQVIEELPEMVVEGKVYKDVIVVEEVNSDDSFSLRLVESYYARGVGLISKKMQILDCDNCDDNLPWSIKGDKGFKHNLRLISH